MAIMTRSMYLARAQCARVTDELTAVGMVGDEPDGNEEGHVSDVQDMSGLVAGLLEQLRPPSNAATGPVRQLRSSSRMSTRFSPLPPHPVPSDSSITMAQLQSSPHHRLSIVTLIRPPTRPHPSPHPFSALTLAPTPSSTTLSLPCTALPPPECTDDSDQPSLNKRSRYRSLRRQIYQQSQLDASQIIHVPDTSSSDHTKTSAYAGFSAHGKAPKREVTVVPMGDG